MALIFLNNPISIKATLITTAYKNIESAVTKKYTTIPILKLPQINEAKLNGATGSILIIMRKGRGLSIVCSRKSFTNLVSLILS